MQNDKKIINKQQMFINWCLSRIVGLKRFDKITNVKLMDRGNKIPMNQGV